MNKKGFTIVEFIIVLAIIGLLAAIAVPSFQKAKRQREATQHGYNVVEKVDRDHIDTPVFTPYECSQILYVNGVKVFRFRKDVTGEWTYLAISENNGYAVSIGR